MPSPTHTTLVQQLRDVDISALSVKELNDLVIALRETLRRVETPWQQMQAMIWENTGHAAALKIAHDLNIFEKWAAHSAGKMSTEQVRGLLDHDCDSALLERVLSALAFKGTLDSPGSGVYALNSFSLSLTQPSMAACLDYWFDIQTPALSSLPAYVKKTSYRLPSNSADTAWNLATNDPIPFFGWLQQRPEKLANFAQVMQCYSESQPPWVEIYPAGKLLDDPSRNDPILVDIGGSHGHDLAKFIDKFRPPLDRCYLLDQADVIAKATVEKGVVVQSHDFFKEQQPIRGARAYYLHNVLHDWTDEQCRGILSNIKQAMDKNHSRILIHELIKLNDGARDVVSVGEFTMMSILGSTERTEDQWRALLTSTGLQVLNVYSHPLSVHSILEVIVAG